MNVENHRMYQAGTRLGGESQSRGRAGLLGGRAVGHQPVRRVRSRRRASAEGSLRRHSDSFVRRRRISQGRAQACARHGRR